MKRKGSKQYLLTGLMLCILVALVAIVYVSIKLQCESLVKEKVISQNELIAKNNWKLNLTAQYQYLTSEEVITNAAENNLKMVKGIPAILRLDVKRNKIEEIQREINAKYE